MLSKPEGYLRHLAKAKQSLLAAHKANKLLFWLRTAYLAALIIIVMFWRAVWTPDLLFLMFLLLFVLYGQAKRFFVSFGPFVFLLLAYDSLRSIVPLINNHVHFTEMIDFDLWIDAGQLPTAGLQQLLYHGHLQWYDYYFYLLYMCHFLFPLLLAVLIWKYRPRLYSRYVVAFLLLSYAGFVTYILFPAAPPWMAAENGIIPAIHKISTDVWWSLGVHDFPSIYRSLSPNLVAAVPSLHAAYPLLVTLFVRKAFGWRLFAVSLIYPLSVWVGVIYMGEHYVFDVVAGIIYTVVTYVAVMEFFARYGHHATRLRIKLGWTLSPPKRAPAVATAED